MRINETRCIYQEGYNYKRIEATPTQKIPRLLTLKTPKLICGFSAALGATSTPWGVNFSVFSKSKNLSVCLFHKKTGGLISEIPLNPAIYKTEAIWSVFIIGLRERYLYAYRTQKNRFILDPYAKMVVRNPNAKEYQLLGSYRSHQDDFQWENDKSPSISRENLIIYEMHTRAFTKDPSSNVASPGTFSGITEKIPHLLALGINAIELQPIQEFDESNYENFWGYNSNNFFSLAERYSSGKTPMKTINAFKTMVRELHKNGIEVILDIAFNHTGEGNEYGPTLSFKALSPDDYYAKNKAGHLLNHSGCGNTFNCNNPVARQLIIDALKYWVKEMHVDGFRFDLASIFFRDKNGLFRESSELINAINNDPLLSSIKLIAEPWDPSGGLAIGKFSVLNPHWQEWNNSFRDSCRRYINGDASAKGAFASAICGSKSLFGENCKPFNSINFITCHDGFTLHDLVSYNNKHNGQDNKDGEDTNFSWNSGEEGVTENPDILRLRKRQMKNFQVALMTSSGTPMLLMGDEYGHSRKGNNNSWNQDNQLNWFLWNKLEENKEQFRFLSKLNKYRATHPALKSDCFLTHENISWHGKKPNLPNWWEHDSLLHFTRMDQANKEVVNIAFNPSDHEEELTLPTPPTQHEWHVVINTSSPSPRDFLESNETERLISPHFILPPYSSILLEAKKIRSSQ